jgi:hypothetical protein
MDDNHVFGAKRARIEEVFATQPGDDDVTRQLRADLLALLEEVCQAGAGCEEMPP